MKEDEFHERVCRLHDAMVTLINEDPEDQGDVVLHAHIMSLVSFSKSMKIPDTLLLEHLLAALVSYDKFMGKEGESEK